MRSTGPTPPPSVPLADLHVYAPVLRQALRVLKDRAQRALEVQHAPTDALVYGRAAREIEALMGTLGMTIEPREPEDQ